MKIPAHLAETVFAEIAEDDGLLSVRWKAGYYIPGEEGEIGDGCFEEIDLLSLDMDRCDNIDDGDSEEGESGSCPSDLQYGGNFEENDVTNGTYVVQFSPNVFPGGARVRVFVDVVPVDEDGDTLEGWEVNSVAFCEVEVRRPPFGGDCVALSPTVPRGERLSVNALDAVKIDCEGWEVSDGELSNVIYYQFLLDDQAITNLLPSPENDVFFENRDDDYVGVVNVQVCDAFLACAIVEVEVDILELDSIDYFFYSSFIESALSTANPLQAANILLALFKSGAPEDYILTDGLFFQGAILESFLSMKDSSELSETEADLILDMISFSCAFEAAFEVDFDHLDTISDAQLFNEGETVSIVNCLEESSPSADSESRVHHDTLEFLDTVVQIVNQLQKSLTRRGGLCGSLFATGEETDFLSYLALSRSGTQLDSQETDLVFSWDDSSEIILPANFGDYVVQWYNTKFDADITTEALYCITLHRTSMNANCDEPQIFSDSDVDDTNEGGSSSNNDQTDGLLESTLEGLTVRVVILGIVYEVEVFDLPLSMPIIVRFYQTEANNNERSSSRLHEKEDSSSSSSSSNNRYSLTPPVIVQEPFCGVLESQCEFDTFQCSVIESNLPGVLRECHCYHLSNFGALLFPEDGNEDWTTLRIVSISLLFGTWLFLILLFLFASSPYAHVLGLESVNAQNQRVLGSLEAKMRNRT
eukprot:CAMPEP_0201502450 /NCGR_PEP_ID=MMETSP0151_2-20130828/84137_1 /ASSEMBLY_ACC=CAM_ASM_000257 /TAXON_ID=200890 /ORGANISM="Paramoeba atlantica, Strain 621/1 / CCAP 1560/9" /LENGTH=701 /DNA_ID=CAMNT_0047896043 /DNA_START=1377 /DNA_END=3482 /DNA_ORIENTATION=-